MYGVRGFSKFILLHLGDQFSQYPVTKVTLFHLLCILVSYVIVLVTMGTWVYI